MKKIAVALIILYCFFVNTFFTVFAESMILEYDGGVHNYTGDVYKLVINGETLTDLPMNPIIFNDRAVVPVREVFEALGATVVYNGNNNTVTVNYGTKKVVLTIGMQTAMVNGIRKTIPDGVGAKLIGKWGEYPKTMVPVRFISENIGLSVGYDGENKIISVTEKSPRPTANPTATPKPTRTPTPVKTASPRDPDDEDEEITTATLTKIRYDVEDDVVIIKVNADSKISKISNPVLTSSGVVYIDVFGAENALPNKTEIYEDVVETVRVGQHDDYVRIAVDTDGVKKYSAALSSTKKSITLKLSGSRTADVDIPEETPTPSTSPSTKPTVSPTETPESTPKAIEYDSRKIVVLDAGHGGIDPGASGFLMTDEEKEAYIDAVENDDSLISSMKHGTGEEWYEKTIALSVVKKIKENLEDNDIEVILTRRGDTYPTLDERPELANEEGAVIFVSVHLNSTLSEVTMANGVEVYYSTQNNDDELGVTSQELAQEILDCVIDATDANSRGVKSGNLLVNRKCMMPSVLIELGFMNNPEELEHLIDEDYQDKLAAGIARGIIQMHEEIKIPKDKRK